MKREKVACVSVLVKVKEQSDVVVQLDRVLLRCRQYVCALAALDCRLSARERCFLCRMLGGFWCLVPSSLVLFHGLGLIYRQIRFIYNKGANIRSEQKVRALRCQALLGKARPGPWIL